MWKGRANWNGRSKHNHKRKSEYSPSCDVCNGRKFSLVSKVNREIDEEDFVRGLRILTCVVCNDDQPISLPLVPDIVFAKDDYFDRNMQKLQPIEVYHRKANYHLRYDVIPLNPVCGILPSTVCDKCVYTYNGHLELLRLYKFPRPISNIVSSYLAMSAKSLL